MMSLIVKELPPEQMNCVIVSLVVATNGIWMRCFSRSVAKDTLCGERWIKTEMCWIAGRRADATKKRPNGSSVSCESGLQYVPRVIITDKLKSYGAAKREILQGWEHRQHKGLNNRAENSHQPTRLREKKMRRFKSAKQTQRFLSAFGPIAGHFQPRRHRLCAQEYRSTLQDRFQT